MALPHPYLTAELERPYPLGAMHFVIESGSYLVSDDSDNGGTLKQAMRFETRAGADAYGNARPWIWANGGMVVDSREIGA